MLKTRKMSKNAFWFCLLTNAVNHPLSEEKKPIQILVKIPLKWILRNTHRASPYSPNLSSQEGVRDVQPSKVPEGTP